jgi:phage-related minor tail protein
MAALEKTAVNFLSLNKDPIEKRCPAGNKKLSRKRRNCTAELQALQSQLKRWSSIPVNDVISQQRKDLWNTENQYAVLEEASRHRALSAQEESLLAHKSEHWNTSASPLGDKVAAQEQLNKRMDTSRNTATGRRSSRHCRFCDSDVAGRNLAYAQLKADGKMPGADDCGLSLEPH